MSQQQADGVQHQVDTVHQQVDERKQTKSDTELVEVDDDNESELLKQLFAELTPENLAKLNDNEVLELRKKMNPYGRTVEGADQFLTFSYTDLRACYLEKLMMTGMIAFFNRMCDEWGVPDGIRVVPVDDYVKDHTTIDPPSGVVADDALEDYKKNWRMMQKRVIVKEFLNYLFQFDPNEHVRSAYVPNPKDDARKIVETPAGKRAMHYSKTRNPRTREAIRLAYQKMEMERKAKLEKANEASANEKKTTEVTKTATEMIPPADLFHRFRFYMEVNYEELRDVVRDLYADVPDLETAINPYAVHATKEDADKFVKKHKNDVITRVYTAQTGKWNIFGNFKKVREGMKFDNKDTEVLDEIMRTREDEEKMGRQLVKNRTTKKRLENDKKDGPIDPNFLKWREQNSMLKENYLGKDERDDECDDNALEVGVYDMNAATGQFKKSVFYTAAEAPIIPDVSDAPAWNHATPASVAKKS
jgi:hypothetical protein